MRGEGILLFAWGEGMCVRWCLCVCVYKQGGEHVCGERTYTRSEHEGMIKMNIQIKIKTGQGGEQVCGVFILFLFLFFCMAAALISKNEHSNQNQNRERRRAGLWREDVYKRSSLARGSATPL